MERAPLNSHDDAAKQVKTKSKLEYIPRFMLVKSPRAWSRKPRRLINRFWDTWNPELVALVFSVTCMIAMTVILGRYDGKATPNILGGLTLNAIVSILATSSKTALIFSLSNSIGQLKWVWLNGDSSRSLVDAEAFDDASRGPLGAFLMLCSHTARSFASFGSLLIILALAFDPFVQQVVSYENRLSFTPSALASLPRSKYIASNGYDFATAKALNAALWQDEFTVMPICPTTDCAWPVIQSVSFAGECHVDDTWTLNDDCSVNLTIEDLNKTNTASWYATRTCIADSTDLAQITTDLDFEVSHIYTSVYCGPSNQCGDLKVSVPRYVVTPLYAMFDEAESIARSSTYGLTFSAPLPKPFFQYSILEWKMGEQRKTLLTATRCTLDIHLDKISTSIVGGKLVTNVTQTEKMGKTLQLLQGNIFICFDSPYEEPQNFSAFAQEIMEAQNITAAFAAGLESESPGFIYDPAGASAGFCINQWQTTHVRVDLAAPKWWTTTMNSLVTVGINASYYSIAQLRWNSTSQILLSDSLVDSLFSQDGVHNTTTNDRVWQELSPAKIVENLAGSLTKLLRDPEINKHDYEVQNVPIFVGADTVPGSVGNVVPYVKIRWPWLILPYILSVGGILFLLYTMYASRKSQAPLWKSSINAFIFHGIDHDYDITSKLNTLSEMDRQAGTTRVRLAPLSEINDRLVLRTSIVRARSNSA